MLKLMENRLLFYKIEKFSQNIEDSCINLKKKKKNINFKSNKTSL